MTTKTTKSLYESSFKKLLKNIKAARSFPASKEGLELENAFLKTTNWCSGLSNIHSTIPARIHLAGAWSEITVILALAPLSFYRQCFTSMRIIIDELLAFSYFETHPIEFKTATENPSFWVSKECIHQFHKIHTWKDKIDVDNLGVWADLNGLYRDLSQYMHAQTLGCMSLIESFEGIKHDIAKTRLVCHYAKKTDDVVSTFLASIYQYEFSQFGQPTQKLLVKHWPKEKILALGLTP